MTTDAGPGHTIAANVAWGVTWGMAMATLFSLLASVIAIASVLIKGATLDGLGQVIASYFLAGVVAGFLVGALKPFARTLVGSILVGTIAGVSIYGSVAYGVDQTFRLDFALTAGIPVGAVLGAWLWWQRRRDKGSA